MTHSSAKTIKCKYCDQYFVNNWARRSHERLRCQMNPNAQSKEQVRRFACEKCGKKFLTSTKLRYHHDAVHLEDHEKPWQCQFCNKGFAIEHTLRVHENT